jgi:hypothetical protein
MVWFEHPHHPHLLELDVNQQTILCMGFGPILPVRAKISVRWETPPNSGPIWKDSPDHKMWVGRCAGCDHTTQYWSWGATYGHMLEHRWIGCKGDKRRGTARQAKFTKLRDDPATESEARLSCGGRTHSIMGDEGGGTVRRADLPSDVSDVQVKPAPESRGAINWQGLRAESPAYAKFIERYVHPTLREQIDPQVEGQI